MLISWLLTIPYLAALGVLLTAAWLLGRPAEAYLTRTVADLPGSGVFALVMRVAVGLSLISVAGAFAGILITFTLPVVAAILAVMLAFSTWYGARHKLPTRLLKRDLTSLHTAWLSATYLERIVAAILIIFLVLLSINSVIGAMVPDMNHDPMWYHLSVPQQWLFDSHFAVYPSVMPSAYPLAVEAIYAVLLLVKVDPVICSLLHAASGILLILVMLSASRMALADHPRAGWGTAAVAALWIPALSGYGMLAPVQPKNDLLVMLWTFSGSMALWLPILTGRRRGVKPGGPHPNIHQWSIGGLLLGTACSGKPIVLGITGLVLLAALIVQIQLSPWRHTLKIAAASLLAMAAASGLWMWRGYTTHGLPLFPLGQSLFPIEPIYQPLIGAFNREHGLPGTVDTGWAHHAINLPRYLALGAKAGETAIFLAMAIAVLGIISARGRWRIYAVMLAGQMLLLASGKGLLVTYRLLAPAYCLAAPLTALLAATTATRLRPASRAASALLVITAMWATTANKQRLIAQTPTLEWHFRPMLSDADVKKFASHAEQGQLYLLFAETRNLIPPSDRVLLLGSHYPFYLHRSTIWNDEVVDIGGVQEHWQQLFPAEAEAFLQEHHVEAVLYASHEFSTTTAEQLAQRGVLERVTLPAQLQARGWSLYRRSAW